MTVWIDCIDSAYDYFSRAFSRALDGYVDSVASRSDDADAVTDAVAFLDERATSGTSLLAEHFERAAVELRETTGEQPCEHWTGSRGRRRRVPERIASSLRRH